MTAQTALVGRHATQVSQVLSQAPALSPDTKPPGQMQHPTAQPRRAVYQGSGPEQIYEQMAHPMAAHAQTRVHQSSLALPRAQPRGPPIPGHGQIPSLGLDVLGQRAHDASQVQIAAQDSSRHQAADKQATGQPTGVMHVQLRDLGESQLPLGFREL